MEQSQDREMVTRLLHEWSNGDKRALEALVPLVYEPLHRIAMRCMRSERPDHTLRATALVNEVYLRLVDSEVAWKDRAHFYAVAATVLRRILVDHARALNREKRGQRPEKIALDDVLFIGPQVDSGVIALDDALKLLASRDQRKSDIVEMVYFGGLTYEEVAAALGISEATVHRELRMAKAWLYQQLGPGKFAEPTP
jgi:RNA polymerase sigma factor (TIGR02999 family)